MAIDRDAFTRHIDEAEKSDSVAAQPGAFAFGATLALFAIVTLVVVQVLMRYVFYYPLAWPEELARYLQIWIVFLGARYVSRSNSHIRVDYFRDRFPQALKQVALILSDFAIVFTSVILVVASVQVAAQTWGMVTPAMGLPVQFFFLPTLMGFAAVAIVHGQMVLWRFTHLIGSDRHDGTVKGGTDSWD